MNKKSIKQQMARVLSEETIEILGEVCLSAFKWTFIWIGVLFTFVPRLMTLEVYNELVAYPASFDYLKMGIEMVFIAVFILCFIWFICKTSKNALSDKELNKLVDSICSRLNCEAYYIAMDIPTNYVLTMEDTKERVSLLDDMWVAHGEGYLFVKHESEIYGRCKKHKSRTEIINERRNKIKVVVDNADQDNSNK